MLTPVGMDTETTWEGLINGKSGIGPLTFFEDKDFPTQIAGEIKGFEAAQYIELKEIKKMDRFIHLAIAASQMAMDDAGLKTTPENADRVGVMVGAGIGGLPAIERYYKAYLEKGYRKISPFMIPMLIINEASGQISIRFGAKGPNSAVVTACATGTHCIGDSFKMIQRGDADAMIAGGTESCICPIGMGGFCAMKALSTRNDEPQRASRPFDAQRDGFVMGEGAGVVILEELEFAQKRGARIYAEVIGYGLSGDAYHLTTPAPNGEGAARCLSMAVKDAGISPMDMGYINAHGTSTKYNDEYETMAVKTVFGDHAYKIPMSSTKSMTGHLLGAAGGVEAVITILAMERGVLPPTINLENPDPECDLDYIPNKARKAAVDVAMSNSFGFGGTNASLIFKKHRK
ncbi:MAG: beta-ketoacyl-[acyl-carrier-protein] synthase II [Nitrospirae bacterium GWC2_57_13]|nr:MAG: beta-ketoacyl-[acyl-carrier-protein] synthase II [Nitrospirae bacterium GWC1_57_7]OGW28421.1 MAG: beta-ketoacyl-[acyl-carrier-protein] synthase II [Nitrospirae bacterium GWC2_57_13]HAR45892.1 beta-ketoacyl-[acyl-carrier-protein] synthase II [Nitrospiraceae bacterium]